MWDAHCHLDDPRLVDDIDNVIERATKAGIKGIVLAGYGPTRWDRQRELTQRNTGLYASYGLHPWYVADLEKSNEDIEDAFAQLEAWLEDGQTAPSLVGIGEFGLDRSRRCEEASWERQRDCCRGHLALARELSLPVVLHVVKAHGEMLAMLRGDGVPKAGGMVHGFTGSLGLVEEYTRLGLHISFGGRITHPNARKAREAAAGIASEWLLCETDAPDMAPYGTHEPNQPSHLVQVIETLAVLREKTTKTIVQKTSSNTKALFGI